MWICWDFMQDPTSLHPLLLVIAIYFEKEKKE